MRARPVVCILGMHRSGTSVLARILNLLGVYLGPPEHLVPPAADNPKGFWEHQRFITLNDEILRRAGGSVDRPPTFPPGWAAAPGLEDLRTSARAVIERDFAGAGLWGWKDPRTCLTVPFWQHILPELGYVLCFRDPVEVVQSLRRREDLPAERGVHLWLAYVHSAVQHTSGQPRCAVCYEDVLEDRQPELRRLASFLGMPQRAEDPGVRQAVGAFLDRGLRHHRAAPAAVAERRAPAPAEEALGLARRFYTQVRQGRAITPAAEQLLRRGLDVLTPVIAEQDRQEAAWLRELEKANQELLTLTGGNGFCILVDPDQFDCYVAAGHSAYPFLERDGQYWGQPGDDNTALGELERLRRAGAAFIAFAWSVFWWRDHYPDFHRYLCSNFSCALKSDRLIVFDLRAPA